MDKGDQQKKTNNKIKYQTKNYSGMNKSINTTVGKVFTSASRFLNVVMLFCFIISVIFLLFKFKRLTASGKRVFHTQTDPL